LNARKGDLREGFRCPAVQWFRVYIQRVQVNALLMASLSAFSADRVQLKDFGKRRACTRANNRNRAETLHFHHGAILRR
jgi:hypothetical protein